jgi:hypothetical protein
MARFAVKGNGVSLKSAIFSKSSNVVLLVSYSWSSNVLMLQLAYSVRMKCEVVFEVNKM